MSKNQGKGSKGSGFPGGGQDDLLDEFDAWDKNFDALLDEPPDAGDGGPGEGLFDTGQDDGLEPEIDLFGEPEALGELLGPSPSPALGLESGEDERDAGDSGPFDLADFDPEDAQLGSGAASRSTGYGSADSDEDDDSVFTSAPRPVAASTSGKVAMPAAAVPAASAPARGKAAGRPRFVPAANDGFDEGSEEVTKIVEVDDTLLAEAAKTEESPVKALARGKAAGSTERRRSSTLSPALVRREDLERQRRARLEPVTPVPRPGRRLPTARPEDDDGDGDFGAEATRIADAKHLESLVESAQTMGQDEPDVGMDLDLPEVSVAVDEEFYDDIEIGGDSAEREAGSSPAQVPAQLPAQLIERSPSPRPVASSPERTTGTMRAVAAAAYGEDDASSSGMASTGRRVSRNLVRRSPQREPSPVPTPLAGMGELRDVRIDALSAKGRALDPEITLDLRVSLDDMMTPPPGAAPSPAGTTPPAAAKAEPPSRRADSGPSLDEIDAAFDEMADLGGDDIDEPAPAPVSKAASAAPAPAPVSKAASAAPASRAAARLEFAGDAAAIEPLPAAPMREHERASSDFDQAFDAIFGEVFDTSLDSPSDPLGGGLDFELGTAGAVDEGQDMMPDAADLELGAAGGSEDDFFVASRRQSGTNVQWPPPGMFPDASAASGQRRAPMIGGARAPMIGAKPGVANPESQRPAAAEARARDITPPAPALTPPAPASTPPAEPAARTSPRPPARTTPELRRRPVAPVTPAPSQPAAEPAQARPIAPAPMAPATAAPARPVAAAAPAPSVPAAPTPSALAAAATPAPAARATRRSSPLLRRAAVPAPAAIVAAPGIHDGTELDAPDLAFDDTSAGELVMVDVTPDLPPAKFPAAQPVLDLRALRIVPEVPVESPSDEELAEQLAMCERELEHLDDAAALARMRLEAGRLAERMGDIERARMYYDEALYADARLTPAMRALRRIERSTGNWQEAVRYLDAELALAAGSERAALRGHRIDLLMAGGEHDLARVAVGEILEEQPNDPRALLANLELAFLDGRDDELADSLERLARLILETQAARQAAGPDGSAPVPDTSMAGALLMLRGRFAERASAGGGDPIAALMAYRQAAEAGAPAGLVAVARVASQIASQAGGIPGAMAARSPEEAASAAAVVVELAATELGARDPAYAAALAWRRALWAESTGDVASLDTALATAASLAGAEPVLAEPLIMAELGRVALRAGDDETAAAAFLRVAEIAASPAERASAEVRAAACLGRLERPAEAVEALGRAVVMDPDNLRAAGALAQALEAAGDTDALIELDRAAAAADPAGSVFERVRAARRLAQTGRLDEAIAELAAGRELAPESLAITEALLELLAQAGRADERIALLAALADEGSEQVDPEIALVRVAQASEARAIELSVLCAQAQAGETATSAEDLEALLAERQRLAMAALEAWQRVLELYAESAPAHTACIRLAELIGDPALLEDVLARAQIAARDRAQVATLALARATVLMSREQPDFAQIEDVVREASLLVPEDPRISQRLMIVCATSGRPVDAAQVLVERASQCTGDEAAALEMRAAAMLLEQADEPAQAAELLSQLLQRQPGFAPAQEMLASARRRMGDLAAIAEDAARPQGDGAAAVRGAAGDDAARLVREAELCHYGAGDPARALDIYAKALALRPGDPLIRAGYERAALAAGDAAHLAELTALIQTDLARAEAADDRTAQADAYEALARIQAITSGDAATALKAQESAAAADSARPGLLRALERAYLAEQRWGDLAMLYQRVRDGLETADRVALLLEEARLLERAGAPAGDVLARYQAAHELDARSWSALFHLEAAARAQGPSPELARLEQAVAAYFDRDLRARAAFLTRAGETLTDLGELETAIASFRQASAAAAGGYAAALVGWRVAALKGQLWLDVADAAQIQADGTTDDAERAALNHLAAVALMDRAVNAERAIPALRRVLDADPAHYDAFVRLHMLFEEQGEHEALVDLLDSRLSVEHERLAQARLHRALADLYRKFLEDPDRAREHLRSVLDLVPTDLGAITALSDIAWQQEEWEEAAEALIQRARLETSPLVLKDIFYRLGLVYSEHVPNADRAIKSFKKVLSYDANDRGALEYLSRLGMEAKDWNLALGACERLLKLEQEPDVRVGFLHRAGEIYLTGFGDRVRAERAYRVALDVAPTSDVALSALIGFFEQGGDLRSMRVHLDRVAAAMRARLGEQPGDGAAYRVIARALEARERAGVTGSVAAARCAAELAVRYGAAEDAETALAAEATSVRPRVAGLTRQDVDELLFPAVVSHGVRQIFFMLDERIAKHVGVDLRRYGVGRSERLRRREDPAMAVAMEIAAELGIEVPAVYVSPKERGLVAVEPGSPISVVLGTQWNQPGCEAELRFAMGRAVKLAASALAVPARMTADEFGVLMVALLRQFDPEFMTTAVNHDAVLQEQQRLRRLIPSSQIQELHPFAISVAGVGFDHKAIWEGINAAGSRAGLVASGSVAASMRVLAGMHGLPAPRGDEPALADLVRFAVSEDYVRVRGALDGGGDN